MRLGLTSALSCAGLVMGLLLAMFSATARAQPATTQPAPLTELSGQLLTPTGEPAVGAQIAIIAPGEFVAIFDSDQLSASSQDNVQTITDQTGFFRFPSAPPTFRLVAHHASGYLDVFDDGLPDDGVLHLSKWARLEGTWAGESPSTDRRNVNVLLMGDELVDEHCRFSMQFSARTDASGKFVFDRLWPGMVLVSGMVPAGPNSFVAGVCVGVELKSGQTSQVHLPALPAKISGKLVLPAGLALKENQYVFGHLTRTDRGYFPTLPMDQEALARYDLNTREGLRQLKQTPEWQDYQQKRIAYFSSQSSWPLILDLKAGTFTTFAAPDGEYNLSGTVMPLPTDPSVPADPLTQQEIRGQRQVKLKNGQIDPPEDAVLTLEPVTKQPGFRVTPPK
jgi:hypothetical protein